jgi:hypothetical protein
VISNVETKEFSPRMTGGGQIPLLPQESLCAQGVVDIHQRVERIRRRLAIAVGSEVERRNTAVRAGLV